MEREMMKREKMETTEVKVSADEGKTSEEKEAPKRRKGGMITMPFIIANEALEKVASFGLLPNMILYLMKDYNIGLAKGQNILFLSGAATNFMPLFGAFLADSYLGRFLTIGFGSIFSFMGMLVLWLTTMIPQARPPSCNQLVETCKSATPAQYFLLISAFALMSIGAGGVRPCSLAFGADQLDHTNKRVMERFFGWYYASATVSVLIAVTGIVYIQDHLGWRIGFGVPLIVMFFSLLSFFFASPLYIMHKVSKSIITSFVRVIVVAFKNRKLALPPHDSDGWYHHEGSTYVVPTNRIRFLNKACIIRDPEGVQNEWSVCTVEQVEELKALVRSLPIWSTGIMISINMSQSAFPLIQANSMDRHVTSNFQIPAGSFSMFLIITICIWVVLYDRVVLPLAGKIWGKPVYLSTIQRMGIGLFLSILASIVSAIVEHIRKRKAIEQGFLDNPQGVLNMSAYWLVPQYTLHGLAEAFNAIGQTEFYYSEYPRSMSSIASAMFGLGMSVANLLASVVLTTVDDATKKNGKESWVSSKINKGHFEKYYWLLAIMSFINLLYFIVCVWAYGPLGDQVPKAKDDKEEDVKEELSKV